MSILKNIALCCFGIVYMAVVMAICCGWTIATWIFAWDYLFVDGNWPWGLPIMVVLSVWKLFITIAGFCGKGKEQ